MICGPSSSSSSARAVMASNGDRKGSIAALGVPKKISEIILTIENQNSKTDTL